MGAVKFLDMDTGRIRGLAVPFDGPFVGGKDLDGEFFTRRTDFCLDWFDEIPLIYHHGEDPRLQTMVVGRVKSRNVTDEGAWAEAQLDISTKYFSLIKELVAKGKLFFSSGSVPHLVQADRKSGEIKRWPWIELSLTPSPINFYATVDLGTAKSHFKAAGLDFKTMPAGTTPVDGDEGDPPEGSYEDLIADLSRALMMMYPAPQCPCILATFPDYCIVSVCEMPSMDAMAMMPSMDMDYYRVAYTLDAMGEPVLGDAVEVQRMYVPGGEPGEMDDGKAIDLRRLARKVQPRPQTRSAANQQTLRLAIASLDADFNRILAR